MTLPLFENQPVHRATVRIVKAGDGLSEALRIQPRALHIGDEVYYLLRGVVTQVNHREDKDELTRLHTVAAERVVELDEDVAEELLAEAAERLQQVRADADGQDPLPHDQ